FRKMLREILCRGITLVGLDVQPHGKGAVVRDFTWAANVEHENFPGCREERIDLRAAQYLVRLGFTRGLPGAAQRSDTHQGSEQREMKDSLHWLGSSRLADPSYWLHIMPEIGISVLFSPVRLTLISESITLATQGEDE